ncbi:hypothetical protein EVAR_19961_1 [Eumeta japonica]|uniref:Uncharacterized protein n=1 Tax=Eumeta variegata TaxID=151549 RepID=A0A4C1YKD4_EUMVA|nr:hypothetical protein EVAR_19961_1 [Eumeta japonica]
MEAVVRRAFCEVYADVTAHTKRPCVPRGRRGWRVLRNSVRALYNITVKRSTCTILTKMYANHCGVCTIAGDGRRPPRAPGARARRAAAAPAPADCSQLARGQGDEDAAASRTRVTRRKRRRRLLGCKTERAAWRAQVFCRRGAARRGGWRRRGTHKAITMYNLRADRAPLGPRHPLPAVRHQNQFSPASVALKKRLRVNSYEV